MRLSQIECNVLLDEFPTVMETRKAVQQLSSGKAPDAINAEVYAFGVCVCVGGGGGGCVTHVRENYGVDSLYVEEGGYPARI